MHEDTIRLLKEINEGTKYATNSIEQVMEFVKDEKMKGMISDYNLIHIEIGERCHELLNQDGKEEREPKISAKTFSWITTEIKLLINDDEEKVADILVDGCHMGVKSVSQNINHSKEASTESVALARRLVETELMFMKDLLGYL